MFTALPHSDVTHIEVWHARFFKLVPESSGDDIHWDIVSDDSTDAGQGGLDRTEGEKTSLCKVSQIGQGATADVIVAH